MPTITKYLAAGLFALGAATIAPIPLALAHSGAHPAMWDTAHLMGMPIYNDQHQKIGTISHVMVSPMGHQTEVVLSVGAFVGGNKQVEVPLAHLTMSGTNMMMHRATKAELEALPAYQGGGDG